MVLFNILSIGSIVIGSLGALSSTNIKNFIAYTSISNLGFIFIGFSTSNFICQYKYFLLFIF